MESQRPPPADRGRYPTEATYMTWDIQRIANTLHAIEEPLADADQCPICHRLVFSDSRLRYVLNLTPKTCGVFLAADPKQPEQACPMLEYGFTCTSIEVGPSAFGDGETAVRFYEHRDTVGGLRLTLTPRHDKSWYIWANVGGDHDGDDSYRIR